MPENGKKFYEFGEFRLDESERLLSCGGEPVHLQSRAFDTLVTLVKNSGRLVTKEDLLRTVWADSFVEENNLTQNIYALRKSLAGKGGENYIETVPRHGYRFTGEVREVFEETDFSLVENRSVLRVKLEEQTEETETAEPFRLPRKSLAAVLLCILTAGVFFVWKFSPENSQRKSIILPPEVKTLAVLPFQIENPTGSDEFTGLVIADDLSRQLRHSEAFKFRFITPGSKVLETRKTAPELGRLLKADAVLTGVFSRTGGLPQIEVNLVRTQDGTTLWKQRFENADGDIYRISAAIADTFLNDYPAFGANDDDLRKHRPKNPEVYKTYLKARALWNKRTSAELHQATILLEQAVVKDPHFALGYAALADAYAFDFTQRFKAVETAEKALELNPRSGEAHASLGFVYLFWDWNVLEAERHFKQAAALSPHYATGRQWYAALFAASGMMSASKEEIRAALELEPVSLPINADAGQILYFADEYDKASEHCRTALELDAGFINAYGCLYRIYTIKQMYPEAVAAYFKHEEIASLERKNVTDKNARLKEAYANGGIEDFWKEMLTPLWENHGYLNLAEYHARLGNKEEALRHLEIAFEKREFGFSFVSVNPVFDDYRRDARFRRLTEQFNLVIQKANR